MLNGGIHASRDGYEPRPVDDEQLAARIEAIDEAARALLVAVLRDASGKARPELTELLHRATETVWDVGSALTGAGLAAPCLRASH